MSEAGRRPVTDLLARASSLLASYIVRDRPNSSSLQVCDQYSVTEFDLDRFESKFHYAIPVTDLFADLQRAGIWPITHYLAR